MDFNFTTYAIAESTFSPDECIRNSSVFIVWTVWMMVLIAIGVPGNILIIVVFKHRQTKMSQSTVTNTLIIALAIIDLIVCAINMPLAILDEAHVFQTNFVCKLSTCMTYFFITASSSMLFMLAVERFISICRPHNTLAPKYAYIMVVLVLTLSLIISGPAFRIHHYQPNHNKCASCQPFKGKGMTDIFNICVVVIFFVNLLGIIILYSAVYRTVYIRATKWRRTVIPFQTESYSPQLHPGSSLFKSQQDKMNQVSTYDQKSSSKPPTSTNVTTYSMPNHDEMNISSLEKNDQKRTITLPTYTQGGATSPTPNQDKRKYLLAVNTLKSVVHNPPVHIQVMTPTTCPMPKQAECTSSLQLKTHGHTSTNKSSTCTQFKTQHDKAQTRVLVMLSSVTVVYIVSWIPFWLLTFEFVADSVFIYYLMFVNNCSNAIVYFVFNEQIRKKAMGKLCKI